MEMNISESLKLKWLLALSALLVSCGPVTTEPYAIDESEEIAQQIAEVATAVDGASIQSNGEISTMNSRMLTSCYSQSFSTCNNGVKTKAFNSCALGQARFYGNYMIRWLTQTNTNKTNCLLSNVGEKIAAGPNTQMTISTDRGYLYTIDRLGIYGHILTWNSGSGAAKQFSLTSDGFRKTIYPPEESTASYDVTSLITSAIAVSGSARASRSLNGGNLKLTNNKTGEECNLAAQAITWTEPSCSCPTAGTWSGSCVNGVTTRSLSMNLVSPSTPKKCGEVVITIDGSSTQVMLDRCYDTSL